MSKHKNYKIKPGGLSSGLKLLKNLALYQGNKKKIRGRQTSQWESVAYHAQGPGFESLYSLPKQAVACLEP